MKKRKLRFQWGALLLFAIFSVLFFVLYVRIVSIQATGEVKGQDLKEWAEKARARSYPLYAERGRILDADGKVIAEDTMTYRLQAVIQTTTPKDERPHYVKDKKNTAKVLAKHIDATEDEIYAILQNDKAFQVEFGSAGKGLTSQVKKAIEKEKLPGIIFEREIKRNHPNGVFASHLIGYAKPTQQDNGNNVLKGEMGLEATYDKQLTGKDGKVQYEGDIYSYLLPNSKKNIQEPQNGNDIYLTLIKNIQNQLEEEMDQVFKDYQPKAMNAIVVDPKTGRILAMSQRPTFNPDTLQGEGMSWLNAPVEQTIEPGSTMKMFTLAAAVDSGNWAPNNYYQSGRYKVGNNTINDHNFQGWGTISYLEGFQRSSNTAMTNLLDSMGPKTFYDYLDRFGFGKKTGIDLPREANGVLLDGTPIEQYTTTFGQGSTTTPIQMVQAATAIANDGTMMKPYVIDKVVNRDTGEVVTQHKPEENGKPVSAETAKTVRDVLASTVTSKVGSAQNFKLEEYEVAGKTATAQVPREDGQGYYAFDNNNFLYGFLGMAPKDDPKLLIYVDITMPQLAEGEYGSKPVSKVFNSVMLSSLKYLNVNPNEVKPTKTYEMEDYTGRSLAEVQLKLESEGLQPIVIGQSGKITEQFPQAGTAVVEGTKVYLKTSGTITLPSFEGWSLQNVLAYQALSGLTLEVSGEGFVVTQSISAGTDVQAEMPIVLKLETPTEMYEPKPQIEEQPLTPEQPDGYVEEEETPQEQPDRQEIHPDGVG